MRNLRLEAFSDGVFAIAVTLLVLDLHTPDAHRSFLRFLAHQWPSYAAYVISFMTIGLIWVNHGWLFAHVAKLDRTVMLLNLLVLMTVAAIPFSTALMAKFLHVPAARHYAAAIYSGAFLLMGTSFTAMWLYLCRQRALQTQLTPGILRGFTYRIAVGPLAYIVAMAAAFASASLSLVICALIAAYFVHPRVGQDVALTVNAHDRDGSGRDLSLISS